MNTLRYKTTSYPTGSRISGAVFAAIATVLFVEYLRSSLYFPPQEYGGLDLYISYDFWEVIAPGIAIPVLLLAGIGLLFETRWSTLALSTFGVLMSKDLLSTLFGASTLPYGQLAFGLLMACALVAGYLLYNIWIVSIRRRRRQIVAGSGLSVVLIFVILSLFG